MYFCIGCGAAIATGQCCQRCLDRAEVAGQSRIPVLHCNFCGQPMKGRMGTECQRCETSRLIQRARTSHHGTGKKQMPKTMGEQQSLW